MLRPRTPAQHQGYGFTTKMLLSPLKGGAGRGTSDEEGGKGEGEPREGEDFQVAGMTVRDFLSSEGGTVPGLPPVHQWAEALLIAAAVGAQEAAAESGLPGGGKLPARPRPTSGAGSSSFASR